MKNGLTSNVVTKSGSETMFCFQTSNNRQMKTWFYLFLPIPIPMTAKSWGRKQGYRVGGKISNSNSDFSKISNSRLRPFQISSSRPAAWPAQKFGGAKMFNFRRMKLLCSEKRLLKHKIAILS